PGLPPVGPFLGVPLGGPGRSRAVLYLLRPLGAPAFDQRDEAVVQPLGAWLEQASLSEEARLLGRLRLATHAAHGAAGSLDLSCILRAALRELDRQMPLNVGAVWLVDEGPGVRGEGTGVEVRASASTASPAPGTPYSVLSTQHSAAPGATTPPLTRS